MATPQAAKLEIFVWQGKDKKGNKIKGEITGTSPAVAKAQLRKQGINATSVRKKPKPLFGDGGKAIIPADIAVFMRQQATMMKAGVPLVQSFELVAEGCENPRMKNMVIDIRDHVAAGGGFADALRKYPKLFDELTCSLVEAGETSGALETMLDRVATYKEKTEALKAKIKKALTYPIAVIVVALIVTSILLIKVVPQFATTFSSFGADLPAFTLFVLQLSNWAQEYYLIVFAGICGFVFGFSKLKETSKAFADAVDAAMLKFPIVGDIIYKAVVARFGRTLATTFAAGVPLVDALESVAGAAGNAVYRKAIYKVRDEVTSGTQMNVALKQTEVFPVLMVQMVLIGEESGSLDEMLEKVALHYEAEVDNAVDNLTALLEPFIMSVLGVLVGGLLVAMYLPIFMLGSVI